MTSIEDTVSKPTVETLKWKHPSAIDRPKLLDSFHKMVQDVGCNILNHACEESEVYMLLLSA